MGTPKIQRGGEVDREGIGYGSEDAEHKWGSYTHHCDQAAREVERPCTAEEGVDF